MHNLSVRKCSFFSAHTQFHFHLALNLKRARALLSSFGKIERKEEKWFRLSDFPASETTHHHPLEKAKRKKKSEHSLFMVCFSHPVPTLGRARRDVARWKDRKEGNFVSRDACKRRWRLGWTLEKSGGLWKIAIYFLFFA